MTDLQHAAGGASAFDPAPAARRLADAWQSGGLLAGLPPGERPGSFAEAYRVQDGVRRLLAEPVAGYKLGWASPRAMKASGLGKPAHGFMPKSRVHADGATLPAPKSGRIIFELEVCFVMGDVVPAGKPPAEMLAAMAGAHLGIELVCSRFVDRVAVGQPSFLADDIGFRGYVLGPAIDRSAWPAAFGARAEVGRNGTIVAPNLDDDSRADPVEALSLFIEDAAASGLPLPKGTLITTGSLVATYESAEPGTYVGELGPHRVTCVIATPP